MNRRSVLKNFSSLALASTMPPFFNENVTSPFPIPADNSVPHIRKIATEEAFTIPEIAEAIRKVVRQGGSNLDLLLLKQLYEAPGSTPASAQADSNSNQVANRDRAAKDMLPKLLDL